MPMAMVPQKQILIMLFTIFDPPAFTATPPDNARNTVANPYNRYTIILTGANKETKNGKIPPDIKNAPEAKAALYYIAQLS
jgi:hypothetical protein